MSTRTLAAVIAIVALISAWALFFRPEPPSSPAKAGALPAERPPLPPSPGSAPATETLDELRLPPIPELLETERAFAAEAVDAAWSAQAEAHLLGEIAQMTGLKLLTLRAECKTSLCRLHVSRQEMPGAHPFPEVVARLGMKARWMVSVVDRNGVPTSLAYLERGNTAPAEPTAGGDIEIRRAEPR